MNAIRVKRRIDSDTVQIPELQGMIGKEVEIIVLEEQTALNMDPQAFWKGKTVDELAAEQGIGPISTLESPVASQFTAEDFEGFDETIQRWRAEK